VEFCVALLWPPWPLAASNSLVAPVACALHRPSRGFRRAVVLLTTACFVVAHSWAQNEGTGVNRPTIIVQSIVRACGPASLIRRFSVLCSLFSRPRIRRFEHTACVYI
jgi:hypothetical protein